MNALLLLSLASLVSLTLSAVLLVQVRQQSRVQIERIEQVIGPHRATAAGSELTVGIARRLPTMSVSALLLQVLNHDPRRRPYYKASLTMVLLGAAVPGLLIGLAASRFFGPVGWLAAPAGCVWLCRAFHAWCEDRTRQALYLQFPDALATIVRNVRVGLPVVEAIRVIGRESVQPTAREFTALAEQNAIGVPLEEALRDMAARNGLQEYRFFATALSLQSQTGGTLTETLENLAETIRKRVATRMRAHALASEARMSAYILAALPFAAGGLMSVFNFPYISTLFLDPGGRTLLYIGFGLLIMGGLTMRTMIRRSLT